MSTYYSPIEEKADPESALTPHASQPISSSPRKPWLIALALSSIAALHVGAKFGPSLIDGAFERTGCHGKHAHSDGYLQGSSTTNEAAR